MKYNRNNKYYKRLCEKVGGDFAGWLHEKYHTEKLNSRDIAELVYNKRKNGPNIMGWMERLDIPKRTQSEAVALQWVDNPERVEQQREFMNNLWENDDGLRERIIEIMQTDEYKEKQRVSKLGERNGMYGVTGKNNPRWNHELTEEDRLHSRKYPEYERWRKSVYERDDYTCQKCKSKRGGDLVAHHINGYHWDEVSRVELDNGVTLCEKCHLEFHATYGYGDNDLFQFAQFMDLTLTK